jgi:hypothetical protein
MSREHASVHTMLREVPLGAGRDLRGRKII